MPTLKGQTVECPQCRERINIKETKSWILEGGIKANKFRIHLYKCGKCGKSFRKAEPI
jgi:DNA-directed RNA polymerase subunit RPC12/RpoP